MFSIEYAEDIIRGRNNLGKNSNINNLSESELKKKISIMTSRYGEPQNFCGLLIWKNGLDTFSFSIYKDNRPFNLTST